MKDDGDCFFRAVSQFIYGIENNFEEFRKKAIVYIR